MAATASEVRRTNKKPPIIERKAPPGKLRAMASPKFDDNPNGDMTEWRGDYPVGSTEWACGLAEDHAAEHPNLTMRLYDEQGTVVFETSRL